MSKLKRQVIRALNIKIMDIQWQIKLIYDFYKGSLDNILDSNIGDQTANTINIKFCLLR